MIVNAWRDGWRRVLAAPRVVAGVCGLTFVLALPLALVLRGSIEAHLGRSAIAADVADGVSYDWWQEFLSQAGGVGATFTPAILRFALTLDNISSVLDGQGEIAPIAAAIGLYLGGWLLLAGGIIDRYARQRPTHAWGFFAASGRYFGRMLRLAAVAGVVYAWLFASVHALFFDDLFVDMTREVSIERDMFTLRLAFYGAFAALLLTVNVLVDYAKIRLVVEDRRSVLGALDAAMRFIVRRPRQAAGLYALNAATFVVLLGIWALSAPGAGGGVMMWIGFAGSQLYLLARLALKLHFLASQTALFQANLAHAAYIAAPAPAWPESPAAEAVIGRTEERPT